MEQLARDTALPRFLDFLATSLGWSFPHNRSEVVRRAMAEVARELGYPDAESCMRALLQAPLGRRQIDALAAKLTVGETYFYREPAVFFALETEVLPALIQARRLAGNRTLRIWSAACCSGEEAYSLAILLHRLLPDLENWRIHLLGTDINPLALQRAEAARYSQWSFRNAPPWLLGSYFEPAGPGRFAVLPHIRRMVRFAQHNLMAEAGPERETAAMDLILCRNALMYFERRHAHRAVQLLRRSLRQGGWLVVGSAEADQGLFKAFAPVSFPGCLFYCNEERPVAALPRWSAEEQLPETVFAAPLPIPPASPPKPVVELPPAPPPEPVATPYERALAARQRGDHAEAEVLLAGLPDDAAALLLLARLLAGQGRLDEAGQCCDRAIAADRINPAGQYLRALIHEEQGRVDEAIQALKRTLYLEPGFILAHMALGNLSASLGRPDADRHYRHALELLAAHAPNEALPESDGLSAGELAHMIKTRRTA
ncbi:tetratricopeptide repeat protein [Chitinimonas arctica]|uniref:Tetratricopeptide repeat protein n=1 Tax=Chitinimonas arctica TaxID=2594795 RepID=A0A516SEI2_9NEIS|nr:CheR family methyltransferase [Chitinimonas arctica]QDQ26574.1 tetratricopeptide repeat protein [Chitinimonas arctica]